jgi:uncharacterized membrane protein YtjA (UPF0391 family)
VRNPPGAGALKNRHHPQGTAMLRLAVLFLILGLVAGILGFAGIAGASFAIAKILFFVFLVIFLVFLLLGVTAARRLGGG